MLLLFYTTSSDFPPQLLSYSTQVNMRELPPKETPPSLPFFQNKSGLLVSAIASTGAP